MSANLDVPAVLLRQALFAELNAEQLAEIAAGTREKRLARGEMLFQKGDIPTGFYVILMGQMKLAFPSAYGNEKVVEILSARQSFGEAVMFMRRPYPVFSEALQDTLLLHIGQTAVFDLLQNDATFAGKLLAGLSQRLHGLVQDVETYSLHSSAQRVIGYLLDQCPDEGGHEGGEAASQSDKAGTHALALQVRLPTSKQVIASRLNLTPETLSRVFHTLSERGLITVSGKHITIADADALRAFDL